MENSISDVIIINDSNLHPLTKESVTVTNPVLKQVCNEGSNKLKKLGNVKPRKFNFVPHPEVTYPTLLPPLTIHLKTLLLNFSIMEKQDDFIAFWATHLETITNGTPSKSDYNNYSRTVVDTFPALAGGKNGFGVVKSQLSSRIRNSRYRVKKQLEKEESDDTKEGCSEPKITKMALGSNMESQSSCNTKSLNASKELEKCKDNDDSNRVKQLMELTIIERRTYIESAETNLAITEIVKKFPQLHLFKLIILEFTLLTNSDEEKAYEAISTMLKRLGRYFVLKFDTEKEKAAIFKRAYEELTIKKFLKSAESLITIAEAENRSTHELLCAEMSSPRLVIYTINDGIASAFVVADNTIKVKIPDPTFEKAVLCLLASYYTWNINYPAAYINTLRYLDQEILNIMNHDQSAVHKFTRKLRNKINA